MAKPAVRSALRSLWDEPRVPHPPPPGARDRVLVAVLVAAGLVEAVARPDLEARPFALVLGIAPVAALWWRRSHPLAAVAAAFGAHGLTYLVSIGGHTHEDTTLYVSAFLLVLPYSLLRWGSGRDVVTGSVLILGSHAGIFFDPPASVGETVAGLAVLELPAALGATMRYRAVSRAREIDQVKSREREQLARELHDTVAHHVSAIAIQAQAGRAVAGSDPAAAAETLAVIEGEATRALAEMRTMVRALRDGEEAALAPQRGIADLDALAGRSPGGPRVEVVPVADRAGLADLAPSVDAAVYRLAQESVTNAIRHARRATCISVVVDLEPTSVRLTVHDDGEAAHGGGLDGYGLVGMRERVTLLGGTFEAGPSGDRGWTVRAELPRAGATT